MRAVAVPLLLLAGRASPVPTPFTSSAPPSLLPTVTLTPSPLPTLTVVPSDAPTTLPIPQPTASGRGVDMRLWGLFGGGGVLVLFISLILWEVFRRKPVALTSTMTDTVTCTELEQTDAPRFATATATSQSLVSSSREPARVQEPQTDLVSVASPEEDELSGSGSSVSMFAMFATCSTSEFICADDRSGQPPSSSSSSAGGRV